MKKFLSMVGKKNIIIISGVILIGVAIYLQLTLNFEDPTDSSDDYVMENNFPFEYEYGNYEDADMYNEGDDSKLGQATLVDNLKLELDSKDNVISNTDEDGSLAVSIVNRQRARDEELELLGIVVESADSSPDIKEKALQSMAAIASNIESEANIETLIKAKGFTDCVAVVNGTNANIIVKTGGLMPNEVAQIKEIVFEQAGIMPQNVKIIEKT